jgi:glycosyltransferase involved in cell wall biosynthesis
MQIFYDGFIYQEQAAGGVNRYFANVIKRLPADCIPLLTTCHNRTASYPVHENLQVFKFKRTRPQSVTHRLAKYYFRYVTSALDFDVAHPTYYSLLTQRDLSAYRRPVVLTVWDMTHELFPKYFTDSAEVGRRKRKAVEVAQAVICISENTKKDLLERYALPADRVHVTHLASEIDASLAHGPELVPLRPYFLFVGARPGYKNFQRLLLAFAKIASLRHDVQLCVVGAPFSAAEERTIGDLKLSTRVESYARVNDAHLAKLYRCSLALVYPSLYEGFGIPPVEAMMCGAAVVASNSSSLPEVIGNAGLLFDPAATDELADILLWLVDNPGERERLVALGRERARAFSWERTAAQTLEVYRSVID